MPHGPGITHIIDPISILQNLAAMMTTNSYQVRGFDESLVFCKRPIDIHIIRNTGSIDSRGKCTGDRYGCAALVDAHKPSGHIVARQATSRRRAIAFLSMSWGWFGRHQVRAVITRYWHCVVPSLFPFTPRSNPVWEPRTRVFDAQFSGDVVLLPPAMLRFADSPWSGYVAGYLERRLYRRRHVNTHTRASPTQERQ